MRAAALVGVVFLGACMSMNGGVGDDAMMRDQITDWSGSLEPVAGSGVMGSAAARSAISTSGVSVTIGRADAGSTHPWHIHEGTCGSGGPIVGDPGAYPVLRVGSDGVASASANLTVGLDMNESYYVNVHESPGNLGTIVACGMLRH